MNKTTLFLIGFSFLSISCKTRNQQSKSQFIVSSEESANYNESRLMKRIIENKPLKILILDAEKFPLDQKDTNSLAENPNIKTPRLK